MPEHITLDTALAEALYALNRAITGFSHDAATHQRLEQARDLVWDLRVDLTPERRAVV